MCERQTGEFEQALEAGLEAISAAAQAASVFFNSYAAVLESIAALLRESVEELTPSEDEPELIEVTVSVNRSVVKEISHDFDVVITDEELAERLVENIVGRFLWSTYFTVADLDAMGARRC